MGEAGPRVDVADDVVVWRFEHNDERVLDAHDLMALLGLAQVTGKFLHARNQAPRDIYFMPLATMYISALSAREGVGLCVADLGKLALDAGEKRALGSPAQDLAHEGAARAQDRDRKIIGGFRETHDPDVIRSLVADRVPGHVGEDEIDVAAEGRRGSCRRRPRS